MSKLTESHLVQAAEFAVVQGIDYKPAFNCWVKHVLKKRDRIIDSNRKQKARYLTKNHKFGIELPRLWSRLLSWMPRIARLCGQRQYLKKWRK